MCAADSAEETNRRGMSVYVYYAVLVNDNESYFLKWWLFGRARGVHNGEFARRRLMMFTRVIRRRWIRVNVRTFIFFPFIYFVACIVSFVKIITLDGRSEALKECITVNLFKDYKLQYGLWWKFYMVKDDKIAVQRVITIKIWLFDARMFTSQRVFAIYTYEGSNEMKFFLTILGKRQFFTARFMWTLNWKCFSTVMCGYTYEYERTK